MPLPANLSLNLVDSLDDLHACWDWFVREPHGPYLGCDTETGGLDWWRQPLRMVQFGDHNQGWAIPMEKWPGLVEEILRRWDGDLIFHNAKFDVHFLTRAGMPLKRHKIHDSMLLSRVIDPHLPAGLKAVSDRLIDPRASAMQRSLNEKMMKHHWDWDTVPWTLEEYWVYAALDPVLNCFIWDALQSRSEAQTYKTPYHVDLACSMVVCDMEQRGIMIDQPYCESWSTRLLSYEEQVALWARDVYGIENIGSDRQLVKFFEGLGIPLHRRTRSGNLSMDEETLAEINHPLAAQVLSYRHANKRRTTYFDPWLEFAGGDGRLHPSFNISGARTARMSCERPNLQNVPRSRMVRRGLIPKEGHVLVLADYDQIELRLMAHFADSKPMIEAIHAGEDLHTYTAKLVYKTDSPTKEQRRIAKHSNFAKIYGAGIAKFAKTAGVSEDEAALFLAGYDSNFPEVRRFQQQIQSAANASGAQSEDGLAHLEAPFIGRQQVADPSEAYKLVNYLIQGTAADVLKMKMIDLDLAGLGRYMTVPIHDELAFEVPENEVEEFVAELPKVMEDRTSFKVPLTAGIDVVRDWGAKYEEGT